MSLFQPIPFVNRKEAEAPIAKQLATFETHKRGLLNKLQNECKSKPHSRPFDETQSWRDLCQIARLYLWGQVKKPGSLSSPERSQRLRQLAVALRRARSLTDRAMRDEIGDELFIAFCTENGQVPYSVTSSAWKRLDEFKEMATGLAMLEAAARAARDKPNKAGRSALLPRDCLQGVARVYRISTGSKPGRGAGPFAEFASGFALAVGKTDFSRRSLIDAIQDAHLQFKPSWFDGKPPSS